LKGNGGRITSNNMEHVCNAETVKIGHSFWSDCLSGHFGEDSLRPSGLVGNPGGRELGTLKAEKKRERRREGGKKKNAMDGE
jgi:hypothetical protein